MPHKNNLYRANLILWPIDFRFDNSTIGHALVRYHDRRTVSFEVPGLGISKKYTYHSAKTISPSGAFALLDHVISQECP